MAASVLWFWRKDGQSWPTFVSFVYVSMGGGGGDVRKALCGAKTPTKTRTTPTTVKSESK